MKRNLTALLLLVLLTVMASSARNKQYNTMADNTDYPTYEADWKRVAEFESEGLPKSALEVVESIYAKAKATNNSPQLLKTMFHKSKYIMTLEEDAQLSIVEDFKELIEESEQPTKSLFESALAELYWQYFQSNQYRFLNRSETEEFKAEDFRTWDLDTLFEEVSKYYDASLSQASQLQKLPLEDFEAILYSQEDSKVYRPTLYDFLAHRALDFYRNDVNGLTKPAYNFEISDSNAFGKRGDFINWNPKTLDTNSQKLKALKIYQQLLKFHANDKDKRALIDADLSRLQFVRGNSILPEKDELYEASLRQMKKDYSKSTAVVYALAQHYVSLGNSYVVGEDDKQRGKLLEAIALCNEAIELDALSPGGKNAAVLKHSIIQPNLNLVMEENVSSGQPSLIKIVYKNIDKVHFKVVRIDYSEIQPLRELYREKLYNRLKRMSPMKTWSVDVNDVGDYHDYSVETNLEGLKNGYYVVVASTSKDFDFATDSALGYGIIQATDIAYMTRNNKGYMDLYLKDREHGKALSFANVEIYTKRGRSGRESIRKTYTADKEGYVKVDFNQRYYYDLVLKVNHNDEEGIFDNFRYGMYSDNQRRWNDRAFIFTDRSIYRPGQTIHFKAIVLESNGDESKLQKNKGYNVEFRDANYQVVKEIKLTTNEYGSFSESFIAPTDRMNGNYQILVNGVGSHSISIEEYKRPKFSVEIEDAEGSFKLGDNVEVTGKAKAYSGANVSNAKVAYRVKRQARYPYWYYYWWRPYPTSEPMEITNGITETDDNGNFKINFEAIADKSIDKADKPVFDYQVIVDVTDINGETRSSTSTVRVGYTAMEASIQIDDVLIKNEDATAVISTMNLNGQPVAAKGNVQIHKLVAPSRVLVARKWNQPNNGYVGDPTFTTLFPNTAEGREDDYREWEKGKVMYDSSFATDAENGIDEIDLKVNRRWENGMYLIALKSKDAFGMDIENQRYFTVQDEVMKEVADNQLFDIRLDKDSYQPGEQVEVLVGSADMDVDVIVEIEHKGRILKKELLHLDNEVKTVRYPVTENLRGGFVVHYALIKHNQRFTGQLPVYVPWTNKELTIGVETFRDKLTPGQEETWKFTVKGDNGEGAAAEMLASMYDASLDQFKSHSWNFSAHSTFARSYLGSWSGRFGTTGYQMNANWHSTVSGHYQSYDALNWFDFYLGRNYYGYLQGRAAGVSLDEVTVTGYGKQRNRKAMPMASPSAMDMAEPVMENAEAEMDDAGAPPPSAGGQDSQDNADFSGVAIRKNLEETAFFFPHLTTNKKGEISFSFTIPESLTKWRFMSLAHTQALAYGMNEQSTITQKELMVVPLQLFNAFTMERIDSEFADQTTTKPFSVKPGLNTTVNWSLDIPDSVEAVTYRVLAKSGEFSDGEENGLPVLSNRMLVTETLPLPIRSGQNKTYVLDKLKNNTSESLKHHKLTLEMTSNPAWYAVQSLPYLMEYPYECAEQTFARYYANTLASHVANSDPKIKNVFDTWRKYQPDALLSNLEKNQELKTVLLEESPWVREAQNESEQKRRVALLFDINKMNEEQGRALNKLNQMQLGNGGWPWFKGGRANRFISQHIVAGLGHLDALNVDDVRQDEKVWSMTKKAINFLDNELTEDYQRLLRYNKDLDPDRQYIGYTQFHYFYTRSFFTDIKVDNRNKKAYDFYHAQMKKFWLQDHLYTQGLIALALHRDGDTVIPPKILASLDEKSITSEELGMYWKTNSGGYYYYQAPIETQALMIEAFDEVANDETAVDELKVWLLKHKQTNSWKTTKATSEAVYALLRRGGQWLAVDELVDITIGGQQIDAKKLEDVSVEAGTGYFKTSWSGGEVTPEMASVSVNKDSEGVAWGALYWQYFEDLDKITPHETPLKLDKKLFLQQNSDKGPVIIPIDKSKKLQVGDLLKVRIELRVDRDMEFIHMKDMRAAGLEPVNVLSQYKWQDGLGYYETTKDANTSFFFDFLPKGVYVFEYPLRVSHSGNFSNGITTIESMYAPEFASHSEGVRITVD